MKSNARRLACKRCFTQKASFEPGDGRFARHRDEDARANADYGDVLPRMVGVLMLGRAIVVINVIRLGIEAFYPVTLLFFMPCLVALYSYSRDPFFLAIAGIVGFGILLTGLTFLSERRHRARSDD